jgi:hypothetical protein
LTFGKTMTRRLTIIAGAFLLVGAASGSTRLPDWLFGPHRSADEKIQLHFLDDGQLWVHFDGKFETLAWRSEASRYYVSRANEDLGYVTRSSQAMSRRFG